MKHACKWHVYEKPWQNKGLRIQESSYLARWLKEKFEWSYLLCMGCDEHFLLFYPPSHVLKRSAASSRFAMHSSYEEVVSGVESPFGLLKPYLQYDCAINSDPILINSCSDTCLHPFLYPERKYSSRLPIAFSDLETLSWNANPASVKMNCS